MSGDSETEVKMVVDTAVEDLQKIINFMKDNNRDGYKLVSVIKIRKFLKIKSKPRRIQFNNCLKLAIQNGDLEQVTGKGATGSFRLPKDIKKKKSQIKSDAKKVNNNDKSPEYWIFWPSKEGNTT